MGARTTHRFAVVEPVRCLDCGKVYAKPVGGGTVWSNPGCPHCGYVGWVTVATPFSGEPRRDRFAADRRPAPLARSG